jgi:hypothetical protein
MAELNLDDLQPDPHTVTFRGLSYELPGVIPVPTILQAVKLERTITAGQETGDMEAVAEGAEQLYAMVMELLRDLNEDVPDLRFNLEDLMLILGMVTSGQAGTTLTEEVVEVVTGGEDLGGAAEPGEDGKPSRPPTSPKPKPGSRSRSRKPSPAHSSD